MKFSLLAFTGLLPSAFAAVAATPFEVRALEANQNFEVAAGNYNFTEDFAPALAYTFNAIASIPDDVLAAGEEAANEWFVENNYRSPGAELAADTDADFALEARDFWKVTKCVGSVMWAIGSTAIPVAKIARIKKYIEALGGVKKAVQLMLGATTKAEKLKAGGQALVSLSAELLGIAGVKANCF
ncbi:hypothetical protein LMH87_010744 [Akanthomyces muscarius]|uniref:Uncharacterized protein n=1 Tax=Akanthomyces muscarius TaxID=2231603 RepID=A0A9W8Q9X9_AKAMU|nr:hypothetical protein LMH87_010744 [Akanthomyces muscarius]KAJ4149972.1 hypothetical protein LMH87_010744 [Akanthomyces muscarius]